MEITSTCENCTQEFTYDHVAGRRRVMCLVCRPPRLGTSKPRTHDGQPSTRALVKHLAGQQGDLCPICQRSTNEVKPVIDHCHTCSSYRGIICANCNLALGHIRDEVEALRRAITYLEGHQH